jgi:bacterioferritin
MSPEETVNLLLADMQGEHQAIIQYLGHAYAMPEGELPAAIEAIARDEMRHWDWLADAIVGLGGDPTMERAPVDASPGTPAEQFRKDVALETHGIAQYRAHVEAIGDPTVQRLLSRILNDELRHHAEFSALEQIAATEFASAPSSAPGPLQPPARVASILNSGVKHEYTVILQYLFHSQVAAGKELAEELHNVAINEMQHMGWLSEELRGQGGAPEMEHTEIAITRDPEAGLKADIAAERAVTEGYTSQLSELVDEGTRALVARIRDHEIYHEAVFDDLLQEVELEKEAAEDAAKPATPAIPSVGSLIDKH